MKLWAWIKNLATGRPHFVIGSPGDPYLLRWYLLPRNPWLNLYLHKFLRDDDDRALHDHPWWFVSLMLRGRYIEHTPTEVTMRSTGSIAFRRATHQHRVELHRNEITGEPIPCWTLILTGRKSRNWGFWCPQGFVKWQDFVDHTDSGNVGRGCEQ